MTTNTAFLLPDLPPQPAEEFLRLGRRWQEIWNGFGVKAILTNSDDLAIFRAASHKTQLVALSYIHFNVSILEEMLISNESPKNTQRYIWRILSRLKLTPPSDFMQVIDDEDLVEIFYINNEVQVFRNFRFMELTSFSLEQLLCLPWYKLTKRSWRPMLAIARVALQFKLGRSHHTRPWGVDEHLIQEIDTPEENKFYLKLKYMIPLKHQSRATAVLSTNRSRLAKA